MITILGFKFGKPKEAKIVTSPIAPVQETVNVEQYNAAKKLLANVSREGKILSHAQLHLICTSYGLVMRHYSDFAGKMPPEKIFTMPELKNKYKMYVCSTFFVKGWGRGEGENRVSSKADTAKHGEYYSLEEKTEFLRHWKVLDKEVDFTFRECPPVFILAPEELFNEAKAKKMMDQSLDPIIVERVGEDEYQVNKFWNVPEGVAVHLTDPNNN